jgi:hypothetical protein
MLHLSGRKKAIEELVEQSKQWERDIPEILCEISSAVRGYNI